MQSDGTVVRNEQAAVERQLLHQHTGRNTIPVQQPHNTYNRCGKARNGQQCPGQSDRKTALLRSAAFRHCRVHPVPYIEDRVGQVKEDAYRVLMTAGVLRILQHGVGNGAVVPGEILLVENEPVHFRIPADRPDVCRRQDLHEGDLLPFLAFAHDITAQFFIVRFMFQENLRVTPHRHQIGGHLYNGVQLFHSFSVRSASEHRCILLLFD